MLRFMTLHKLNKYVDLLTIGFSKRAYELYGRYDTAEYFSNILDYDWSIFDKENKANDHRKNLGWAYESYREIFDNHRVYRRDILCIVGCPGPLVMGAISPWFYKSGHPIIAMFKPGEGAVIIQTYGHLPVLNKDKQLRLIGNTIPNKYFKPNYISEVFQK